MRHATRKPIRDPYVEQAQRERLADLIVLGFVIVLVAGLLANQAMAQYEVADDGWLTSPATGQMRRDNGHIPESSINRWQQPTQPTVPITTTDFGNGMRTITDGAGNRWNSTTIGNFTTITGSDGSRVTCTVIGTMTTCN